MSGTGHAMTWRRAGALRGLVRRTVMVGDWLMGDDGLVHRLGFRHGGVYGTYTVTACVVASVEDDDVEAAPDVPAVTTCLACVYVLRWA